MAKIECEKCGSDVSLKVGKTLPEEKKCEHNPMPYHYEDEPTHFKCSKCFEDLPDAPTQDSSDWEITIRKDFYRFFDNINVDKNCKTPDRIKMQASATYWINLIQKERGETYKKWLKQFNHDEYQISEKMRRVTRTETIEEVIEILEGMKLPENKFTFKMEGGVQAVVSHNKTLSDAITKLKEDK